MIFFISKLQIFFPATGRILNPKGLDFLTVQKPHCIKGYFFVSNNCEQKRFTYGIRKSRSSENAPKKFAGIIDLGEFTDWKMGPKQIRGVKTKRKVPPFSKSLKHGVEEDATVENDTTSYKSLEKNAAILSEIMTSLKARRGREKYQKIVLEGKRLIYDAVSSGFFPELVFFTRISDVHDLNLPEGTKKYRVPYKSCQLWGDVCAHQGVIGVFDTPDLKNQVAANCLPLTVVCDNIRDPGNLGAILRVCASVECEKLILTKGCTSIWEPKVLRSAAGAHFHFAAQENVHWENIQDEVSGHASVFLSDTLEEESKNPFVNKSSFCKELQQTSYLSVEFNNKGTIFVIGGETHGLSEEAYKFAKERNGTRIHIPLSNKIDSLNTSVALAVLAFEFKRQVYLKYFPKNVFSI